MKRVAANQRLTLRQADGKPGDVAPPRPEKPLFEYVAQNAGIDLIYRENDFDDYAREVLLPHRMSTLGPCTASGDVNGDGLEDFFIGGSIGYAGVLYLQTAGGTFMRSPSSPGPPIRTGKISTPISSTLTAMAIRTSTWSAAAMNIRKELPNTRTGSTSTTDEGNLKKLPATCPICPSAAVLPNRATSMATATPISSLVGGKCRANTDSRKEFFTRK